MSLSQFVSPSNFSAYTEWSSSAGFNRTYEQWAPSEDYRTLTVQLLYENDTLADERSFNVTGDLRTFYENLDDNDDEVVCYASTIAGWVAMPTTLPLYPYDWKS